MIAILLDKKVILQMVICMITLNSDCTFAVDTRPQLLAVKENDALQFNCSTSKEPIGMIVEILIDGITKFNLQFDNNKCYQKNKICGYNDCSCSHKWFYWQQNETSNSMTIECHMRYKDNPGTDVSANSFYNGSAFFNLYTTTSKVLPTENTTNKTKRHKANSLPVIGMVTGVAIGILMMIMTIIVVICVWKRNKSKPNVGKDKGNRGKFKTQNDNPPHVAPYIFTEAQIEKIGLWVKKNKLLYDKTDRDYENKELHKQLWARQAELFNVDYKIIQKWFEEQKDRIMNLQEGQPKKKSQKKFDDGVSNADEGDPLIADDASEKERDRNKFILGVFKFLNPHIRRDKNDTLSSESNYKFTGVETGELAGNEKNTTANCLEDKPRELSSRHNSRIQTAAEVQTESPTIEMRVTGASIDPKDMLLQPVNQATHFCNYLGIKLNSLHDVCLDHVINDINTVLYHYQKFSIQVKSREAAGEQIGLSEDVPSAFQSAHRPPTGESANFNSIVSVVPTTLSTELLSQQRSKQVTESVL